MGRNFAAFLTLAAALTATTPGSAYGRSSPIVAVLPLAAVDTGVPYGLLPSPAELEVMTADARSGLRDAGVTLVPQSTIEHAMAALGFDQTAPIRSCVVAQCARRIGRAVHADEVVVGGVTRVMAVVWGTQFWIFDVRTGNVVSTIDAGFKGDVQSMELGDREATACLARAIEGKPRCRLDRGW
jgi:hypothetical protein